MLECSAKYIPALRRKTSLRPATIYLGWAFGLNKFLTQTCPRYTRVAHQNPSVQSPANIKMFLSKYICNLNLGQKIYLDEWRSMEKHSLIALIVILLSNLSPPVAVFLPQFCVPVNSSFHWWTLQRNSKGTSKVLQWYFNGTSMVFQEYFKRRST